MPRVKVKLDVMDVDVKLNGKSVFGEAAQRDAFAYMVKNEIADIDKRNTLVAGRDVPYVTYVDGVKTDNLFSAGVRSTVVAEWQLGYEVVIWIWELLRSVGPVGTKPKTSPEIHYRESVRVYADGVQINDPVDSIGAKEILFLSIVPYARKIQRGLKGYAPGAVYEVAAAMAKSKFSNYARIKFTYAEPPGAAPPLDAWAFENAAKEQTNRKARIKVAKNRRQPAIVVYQ